MQNSRNKALSEREDFIMTKGDKKENIKCDQQSLAGAVSQRACVYSGARVVLNPVKDAYHLVHGPIGCASYTWDIRGSLTSGADVFRSSFSTDLKEKDIVFGGETKLKLVIEELMEAEQYEPEVIFIYSTCVVGVIGDDLKAAARKAEKKYGIRVIPVESSGFAGTKSKGYKAACEALLTLMDDFKAENNGVESSKKAADNRNEIKKLSQQNEDYGELDTKEKIRLLQKKLSQINSLQTGKAIENFKNKKLKEQAEVSSYSKKINLLGDYNLAGEGWIIENYLNQVGIELVARFTGDSSIKDIRKAPTADLNIVQCAGSMKYLAKRMEKKFGIPFLEISFLGLQDSLDSLRQIAQHLGDQIIINNVEKLIARRLPDTEAKLRIYKNYLSGKKAAIYVGGAFKAISLVKQFNDLGIKTVMVGTQNGKESDYEKLRELTDPGTIILDDANPSELEVFMREKGADVLVGGVKDRALAYKMGIAFFDHNHERKDPLVGFEGVVNLAQELDLTINSPIWKTIRSGIDE
ncbi:nitrogenase molybdenum-cofactor synthesis protein NifE [Halanaerobium saccharolyticum]|uniref:Nitrogenase molybdenum-cofactor synthesis protein NifE n=1 Tax=Halanaerobium saccharolyticum TaxID=43595 RepID=A0A4R6M0F4_9FIRM|nr:nitrogenase component 1 [Halanaerobium saccharolyticum]TDO94657.1 nitrogenase molybdenum-cofactor synthesis protein NifE [Halanaerobium saccharolyticum]